MPAQPLSADQKADAARLKAIYNDKRRELNLTQDSLASACGWDSQGSVSQYLNGKIPLNLPAALKFAAALRCNVADFSPRLAASLPTDPPPQNHAIEAAPLESTRASSDIVMVRVFDVKASMGPGFHQPDHETVVDGLRLARDWVRTNLPALSSASNLAVISAYGDSMAPTFTDGDVLLVDRGVQDIRLDAVYVLALNNELYVKRIQRRITDGAVIIKSDNPLYDPVVVDNGDRNGLRVLGRVVWAWHGRKL